MMFPRTELPSGWQWTRLGNHVTKVGSGVTPRGGQEVYQQSGTPLIRSQNVLMNQFSTEGLAFISAEIDEAMRQSRVLVGDVLLNITGASIGRVCVVPSEMCPANVNQHVSIIRSDGSIYPEFLAFYLASPSLQKFIDDLQAGATRQALTKTMIEGFEIPLPPLPEQRRIAAVLAEKMTTIEQARAAAQAQLEAAQALPAAYLREVFESPEAEKWPTRRIEDIAVTTSGTTPSRNRPDYYQAGTIPWIKTGELHDGIIEEAGERITEIALEETSLNLLPVDTLLIAMYGQGQTRGRTGILGLPATTNQACFAILPNPEVFDTHFLQFWFRHNYVRLRQETEARGGNQPNLNGKILRSQRPPLPRTDTQKQIVARLRKQMKSTEHTMTMLEAQLDTINALPVAYLRQAFNGEL